MYAIQNGTQRCGYAFNRTSEPAQATELKESQNGRPTYVMVARSNSDIYNIILLATVLVYIRSPTPANVY